MIKLSCYKTNSKPAVLGNKTYKFAKIPAKTYVEKTHLYTNTSGFWQGFLQAWSLWSIWSIRKDKMNEFPEKDICFLNEIPIYLQIDHAFTNELSTKEFIISINFLLLFSHQIVIIMTVYI